MVLLAQSLSGDTGKGNKAVTVADVMEFIEDGGKFVRFLLFWWSSGNDLVLLPSGGDIYSYY